MEIRSRNLRGTKSRLIVANPMRSRRTAENIFGAENKSVAIGTRPMAWQTMSCAPIQWKIQHLLPKKRKRRKERKTKEFRSMQRLRKQLSKETKSDCSVEFRLIVQTRWTEIEATTKEKKKMKWIVLGGILRIGPITEFLQTSRIFDGTSGFSDWTFRIACQTCLKTVLGFTRLTSHCGTVNWRELESSRVTNESELRR
eukprot:scaffold19997_cov34-Attheya_sp.AAC.2